MEKDLQIYIHIPFCIRRCSGCGAFTLLGDHTAHETYLDALQREIDAAADSYSDHAISSVYIGGGSPTCMSPDHVSRIVRDIRKRYDLVPHCEVSIEAMPQTIGTPSLSGLNVSHITRYSLSMQSSSDAELAALDCSFTNQDVINAGMFLEKFHLTEVNLDLMYGFDPQTAGSCRASVRQATDLFRAPHVSLYPYRGTDARRLDAETRRSLYGTARSLLVDAGYEQYSAYHFAKSGHRCDHFVQRYSGCDYLGFGMGARSLIDGITYVNTTDWDTYIASSADIEKVATGITALSPSQMREEYIRENLNLVRGVDRVAYGKRFGTELEADYGSLLANARADGRFIVDDAHLAVSPKYLCDIDDIEVTLF